MENRTHGAGQQVPVRKQAPHTALAIPVLGGRDVHRRHPPERPAVLCTSELASSGARTAWFEKLCQTTSRISLAALSRFALLLEPRQRATTDLSVTGLLLLWTMLSIVPGRTWARFYGFASLLLNVPCAVYAVGAYRQLPPSLPLWSLSRLRGGRNPNPLKYKLAVLALGWMATVTVLGASKLRLIVPEVQLQVDGVGTLNLTFSQRLGLATMSAAVLLLTTFWPFCWGILSWILRPIV